MNRRDFVMGVAGATLVHPAFGRVDRMLQQGGRSVSVFRTGGTTSAAADGFATCVKVVGIGPAGNAVLRLLRADGVGVVAETISIGAEPGTLAHDKNRGPWMYERVGGLEALGGRAADVSILLDGTHLAIVVVGDADATDLRLATGVAAMARRAGALTFAITIPAPGAGAPTAGREREAAKDKLSQAGAWLLRGPTRKPGEPVIARLAIRHHPAASLHLAASSIHGLVGMLDCKLIGIDLEDIRACFPGCGVVSHAVGRGIGSNIAALAARRALAGREIARALPSAKGVVVAIEGNQAALKMKHVEDVLGVIYPALPANVSRVCGTVINDKMPCHMLGVGIYVAHQA